MVLSMFKESNWLELAKQSLIQKDVELNDITLLLKNFGMGIEEL